MDSLTPWSIPQQNGKSPMVGADVEMSAQQVSTPLCNRVHDCQSFEISNGPLRFQTRQLPADESGW